MQTQSDHVHDDGGQQRSLIFLSKPDYLKSLYRKRPYRLGRVGRSSLSIRLGRARDALSRCDSLCGEFFGAVRGAANSAFLASLIQYTACGLGCQMGLGES